MIIYLAGNGSEPENENKIKGLQSSNWGILISYKDVKAKHNKGSRRFKRIKKNKK